MDRTPLRSHRPPALRVPGSRIFVGSLVALLQPVLAACVPLSLATAAEPAKGPALPEAREVCKLLGQFATGGASPYQMEAGHLVVPFPGGSDLDKGSVVAYEEHKQFTYLVLDLSKAYAAAGKDAPGLLRRVIHFKPATIIVDDQVRAPAEVRRISWSLSASGMVKADADRFTITDKTSELTVQTVFPLGAKGERTRTGLTVEVKGARQVRFAHVLHVCSAGQQTRLSIMPGASADPMNLGVSVDGLLCSLSLPADRVGPGRIAISATDGKAVLAQRLLPSGVMPHGPEGIKLMERWDGAYRSGKPGWDTGRPSSELMKLVEGGTLKPGKAVDLGCGAGTNAIYLASKGFDVTGIDVAPTGLGQAMERARKAGVKVRWLLADVLNPPDLEPFDLVFDRGCYHHLRRINAPGYVEAVRRCTRPGSRILILAGNANETPHWGPPRVKEEELRGDFTRQFDFEHLREIRFDAVDPKAEKRALAWSALLRRKDKP